MKAVSLNDEAIIAPRLRKDQREKMRSLARNNEPLIALGLIRDALKGYSAKSTISEDETSIVVTMRDDVEKVETNYEFPFKLAIKCDPPTLD